MALKESVVDADKKLMQSGIETRRFITVVPLDEVLGTTVALLVTEVTETKEEKWYALTQDAAETEQNANVQPEDDDATYTYDVQIENEVIESYTLTRAYQKITTTSTFDLDPAPNVTFSPVAGSYPAGSTQVELKCDDPDAWIFYEVGSEPEDPTTGSSKVPANTEITITIPASGSVTIKAFAYNIGLLVSDITSATYTDDEL